MLSMGEPTGPQAEIERRRRLSAVQQRLATAHSVSELCQAITELVASLLGSEEFAVYALKAGSFQPLSGMGVTAQMAQPVDAGLGEHGLAFLRGAVSGTALLGKMRGIERPVGWLVIGTLVRHKPHLTLWDEELLSVLRTHAGAALAQAIGREGG